LLNSLSAKSLISLLIPSRFTIKDSLCAFSSLNYEVNCFELTWNSFRASISYRLTQSLLSYILRVIESHLVLTVSALCSAYSSCFTTAEYLSFKLPI
jgi:hypothetical protein